MPDRRRRRDGVPPEWTDEPVRTRRLLTDGALGWGWLPQASLAQAMDELRRGPDDALT